MPPQDRIAEIKAALDAVKADAAAGTPFLPEEFEALTRVERKLLQAEAAQGTAAPALAPAPPSPPARSLSGAVGQGGRNAPEDVRAVQGLLNGAGARLAEDGLIGPATIGAIVTFQRAHTAIADGRVDPGGPTWQALTGQSAGTGPAPAAADPAVQARLAEVPLTAEAGEQEAVRRVDDEAAQLPDGDVVTNDGAPSTEDTSWYGRDASIKFGNWTLGIKIDENGNLAEAKVERKIWSKTKRKQIKIFGTFAKIGIKGAISAKGPGPIIRVQPSLSVTGEGFVGLGPSVDKIGVAAVGVSFSLTGSAQIPVWAEVDMRNPSDIAFDGGLPMRISLSGAIKVGVVMELDAPKGSGDTSRGYKHMVPIRSYKDILYLDILPGPDFDLDTGPGLDQIVADINGICDWVSEQFQEKLKEPARTGLVPDMQPMIDELERQREAEELEQERQDTLAQLRSVEGTSVYLHDQIYGGPVPGRANHMGQQDKAKATRIYGPAWAKAAQAKWALDAYQSVPDSASLDQISAKLAESTQIQGKFQEAIAAFQAGDTQT